MERAQLLHEYADFLKRNYVNELEKENRNYLDRLGVPLQRLYKHLSVEKLMELKPEKISTLLNSMEKVKVDGEEPGIVLEQELEAIKALVKENLEPSGLLKLYTAQKQALFRFIPEFTSDAKTMHALVEEIEHTFMGWQDATVQVYFQYRTEVEKDKAVSLAREETARIYIARLQAINEELQDANNKLFNANEELQSQQEEIQASNEELQLHQEELQAINEELRIQQEELLAYQNEMLITQERIQSLNDELIKKETELLRSNESLQHFASVASHDLKEPLRMVKMYVQLLARRYKDRLDQDANDFIGFAVDGSIRMEFMIQSLLDYARLQNVDREDEVTNLNNALNSAQDNLTMAIRESAAKITCRGLPSLKVNEVQFTHVFQNLLSNAIKYRHPERIPEIHIGYEQKENEWFFCVSDNGIGLNPENYETVFQPFKRLHSWKEVEGIGLGLSFCKKIIEQYGGDMWVESEPGKGTTFFFTIQD
jgi:signal transduction histidine kinase